MAFATIAIFSAGEIPNKIIGCTQRCNCEEGYEYIDGNENCIKHVRIFFLKKLHIHSEINLKYKL